MAPSRRPIRGLLSYHVTCNATSETSGCVSPGAPVVTCGVLGQFVQVSHKLGIIDSVWYAALTAERSLACKQQEEE
jgi:hypothetical protein